MWVVKLDVIVQNINSFYVTNEDYVIAMWYFIDTSCVEQDLQTL